VHEFAHVESGLGLNMPEFLPEEPEPEPVRFDGSFATGAVDENELKAIFERTYGKREDGPKKYAKSRRVEAISTGRTRPSGPQEQYLLVDGYNIIFAWEDLSELAKNNIDAARDRLMDILCNYQGYRKMNLILVFDAYKVPGGQGEVMKYHNIHVVYTREAETADQYIEKTVRQIGKNHRVCVATSDALEQVIIMGAGAIRMSAKELQEEILSVQKELREAYIKRPTGGTKTYLFDGLSEEKARLLKKIEGDGPE
jgi:predicted RNA-binding protein with PIN domain